MKISGLILAGGRSSRMQANKAFVELNGQKIIEGVLEKLSCLDEIIIITNEPAEYEKYRSSVLHITQDIIPGKGPLSGIHAGLTISLYDFSLVVACDMPFINLSLAAYMLSKAPGYDVVVPRINDNIEPLFSIYDRGCREAIETAIKAGRFRTRDVYRDLRIKYIEENEIRQFGDPEVMFYNVNNRQDLVQAENIARRVG
ncbi:MAG: molybdenum cofactor guanylyltransferase [Acidobacteriota bacterium]